MNNLPTGTVTFLFTDIEGSTRLWEAHPEQMQTALARHDALMRGAIEGANGHVFKTVGDSFHAAFPLASEAVSAALTAQRALLAEPWPEGTVIKVRMALHTGTAESRDDDYFGEPLNRVARLLPIGHGGQTLLSRTTYTLVRDSLPPKTSLREMGEHRLKDLGRPENVFQLIHPDLPSDFSSLRSLSHSARKHNLPPQMTSFIGREKEIAAVQSLLAKTRLLTLTGAGGSGKTRLSLQVAAEQMDAYEDGTWLVELATLTNPDLVPQAAASVLGVKEEPGKPISQTLTETLKNKRLLLLLDNCEHLLDASAKLADALVRQCPGVRVLASSREALGLSGEQTYRVPSLSLPNPKQKQTPESLSRYESVQLFVERAVLAQPTFQVRDKNASALASLCFQLDGIPLAIELAAARMRSLSVEEINGKLDQRFRLLTGGSRTALPRQQTLRALIEWSYRMLTDLEQEAFEQLSVFVGGWSLEMAERTCGDPIVEFDLLDLVTALVDKSLVNYEASENGRYACFETIRHFAREQLAVRPEAEAAALRRHAETMAAFGMERVLKFRTAEEATALQQLTKDTPNVAAALAWSKKEANFALTAQLTLALAASHQRRGYPREGTGPIDEVLAIPDSLEPEIHARLLCERATLALDLLEEDTAAPLAAGAGEIARSLGSTELTIRAENLLGQVAMARKDYALTRHHYNEALRLSEQAQNWIEMARLQNNLGIVERRDPNGDKALAEKHYRAALAIQRTRKHSRGEAETLNSLGVLAQSRGHLVEAASLYLEAAHIETELEHPFGVAKTLSNYGEVMTESGEDAKALLPFGISEQLFSQIRSPYQEYTADMLNQTAARLGWTAQQLEDFRESCGRIELKDAVNASLQTG